MIKNSKRRENRIAALQFLYAWEMNKPDTSSLSAQLVLFFEEKEKGREYYVFGEELIDGVIDCIEEVDSEIKQYTENWDFDRIAKMDLAILRLAIYELLKRLDIPPIVSINEAIDLSKLFSSPDSKRFINGILDKMKNKISRPLREASDI